MTQNLQMGVVRITQGYLQCHRSKIAYDFLLAYHSYCVLTCAVSERYRDIGRK